MSITTRNHSLWADTASLPFDYSTLHDDQRVDVAVVGGGFTGLSTAYHLVKGDPNLRVAVLEKDRVGDGASGRNAGAVVSECGVGTEVLRRIYGAQKALQAAAYGLRAREYVRELITAHAMDSDLMETGSLTITLGEQDLAEATAPPESKGEERLSAAQLQQEYNSPILRGAVGYYEPDTFMINPFKHVRELLRITEEVGAVVYEDSPAIGLQRTAGGYLVKTPTGSLLAKRLVLATNGYSHLLPGALVSPRDQAPAYAYQIATEPLNEEQWATAGIGRQAWTENDLSLFHWLRTTPDRRLVFGGRYMRPADSGLQAEYDDAIFRRIERDLFAYFPQLTGLRVSHRWGGPISLTMDGLPHIGFADDAGSLILVDGCWGHGVALAHLHGLVVADLLRGRRTEISSSWLVQRTARRFPPAPLGAVGLAVGMGIGRLADDYTLRRHGRRASEPTRRQAFRLLS